MRAVALTLLLLAGGMGSAPAALAGQACAGGVAAVRGFTIAPALRVQPGELADVHTWGLDGSYHGAGGISLEGGYGYGYWPADTHAHSLRLRPSFELARGRAVSLCVVGGAQLTRTSTRLTVVTPAGGGDFTLREYDWRVPLGVSAGASHAFSPASALTLYAFPHVRLWKHGPHNGVEDALEVGSRLRRGEVFGGVSYLRTGSSGLNSEWTLTLGLASSH